MTINQLEDKIMNKKAEIAHRESLIAKLEAKIPTITDKFDKEWAEDDLHTSKCKLADLKETLARFEAQLAKAKEAKKEQDALPVIQDIKDFLDEWEERVVEYVKGNVDCLRKYHEADSKYCEIYNTHGYGYSDKEEWRKALESAEYEANGWKSRIHPLTARFLAIKRENGIRVYGIDEKALRELLAKEKELRYAKLVRQVIAEVGVILEAKNLYDGEKGDINGYVKGENGTAHVWTIGAGGWNIQCFHYRTLVKKVA